ncbi:hypothetical protein A3A66_00995 [Microgenomates group bacterium RIFCSPLOWO2_01_FULL_46_13]|nr:MAG: hypothetical protein A2783_01260 [Microgenomates group bacterium RIFCSPHIGHO2_01_FULL_45_11]OGV94583.1 MAG: hypothetical protein A3A66_00995 [Microgenomates group bacterium RIFCSPLOWO2_01_FULL_46_13]
MHGKSVGNERVSVLLILLSGLVLRLIGLNQSFWLDEAAQAIESSRSFVEQFKLAADFQPPGYHLIVHTLVQFNRSEWWLRLSAVVPGVLTIYFTYLTAKRWGGEKVGKWAAMLLATSQFHIYYSQELRPYSLVALWGVMSLWAWDRFLINKKWSWILVITMMFGFYTMYLFGFLVLGTVVTTYLTRRKQLKLMLKHVVVAILPFIFWLPQLWQQVLGSRYLVENLPGWQEVVSLPLVKALPLTVGKLLIGRVPFDFTLGKIILTAVMTGSVAILSWSVVRKSEQTSKFWLVVVPLLSVWLFSLMVPVIEPKRLMYLLPIVYGLVALGGKDKRWGGAVLTLIVLMNLTVTFSYYRFSYLKREQWRQAVNFIETEATPDTAVLFAFPEPFAPWQWYESKGVKAVTTQTLRVRKETNLNSLLASLTGYRQVYVFEYLMDLTDPERRVFAWLYDRGYQQREIKDFSGVGFVYLFEWPRFTANTSL